MKLLDLARTFLGGFLDYWKWAAALACVALLIASHVAVYKVGHRMAEADQLETDLATSKATLDDLSRAIGAAASNGAALEKQLAAMRREFADINREIANVLPAPEADHDCDLPAAARGLLNRASGYPDSAGVVGTDGGGGAAATFRGRGARPR